LVDEEKTPLREKIPPSSLSNTQKVPTKKNPKSSNKTSIIVDPNSHTTLLSSEA